MLHEDEFVVEITSSPGDQIRVVIDAMGGLPISRCVEVSRAITQLRDRDEEEDYALEVSSPSLSDPWQVYEQYTRHLEAPVQAVDASGMKWHGKLIEVGARGADQLPEYVVLEIERTETIQDGKKKKKQQSRAQSSSPKIQLASRAASELDIRGYETLEAESVVDNYIDSAVMAKLGSVTIIHGKGTGALRKAVHEILRRNKAVKSFRLGRYGEGEAGVTIVELK